MSPIFAGSISQSLNTGTYFQMKYNSIVGGITLNTETVVNTETKDLTGYLLQELEGYDNAQMLGMDTDLGLLYIGTTTDIVVIDTKSTATTLDDEEVGVYNDTVFPGFSSPPYNLYGYQQYNDGYIDTSTGALILRDWIIDNKGTKTTSDDEYLGLVPLGDPYRKLVMTDQGYYAIPTGSGSIMLVETNGTKDPSDDIVTAQYEIGCSYPVICITNNELKFHDIAFDDVTGYVYLLGRTNYNTEGLLAIDTQGTSDSTDDTVLKNYSAPVVSTVPDLTLDFSSNVIFWITSYSDGRIRVINTNGNHDPTDDIVETEFINGTYVSGVPTPLLFYYRRILNYDSNTGYLMIYDHPPTLSSPQNILLTIVNTNSTPDVSDDVVVFQLDLDDYRFIKGGDTYSEMLTMEALGNIGHFDSNAQAYYLTLKKDWVDPITENVVSTRRIMVLDIAGNSTYASLSIARKIDNLGQWISKAHLDTGRWSTGYGAIGNKFYVAAGTKNWTDQNTLEIYDYDTDSWSSGANMPESVISVGSIVYNNELYVMGGKESGGSVVTSMYKYTPGTNSWTTLASMNVPRASHAVQAYNGKIYVMGGTNTGLYYNINSLEIYDIATNSWTSGADIPVNLGNGPTSSIYNGKIYLTGGAYEPSTNPFNTLTYVYDTSLNSWSTGVSIPEGLTGLSSTTYNEKWYVIGGNNDSWNSVNSVYIFDFKKNTWSNGVNIPSARHKPAVAVIDNGILLVGGRDINWDGSDSVSWIPLDILSDSEGINFSKISWTSTEPAGTSIEIYYSTDQGATFTKATSASKVYSIPTNSSSEVLYNVKFFTNNPAVFPTLNSVSVSYDKYKSSGSYISSVSDGGALVYWKKVTTQKTLPDGTSSTVYFRSGNTSVPDSSWSAWKLASSISSELARYAQTKVVLSTSSKFASPVIKSISLKTEAYTPPASDMSPNTGGGTTTDNDSSENNDEETVQEEVLNEIKINVNKVKNDLLVTWEPVTISGAICELEISNSINTEVLFTRKVGCDGKYVFSKEDRSYMVDGNEYNFVLVVSDSEGNELTRSVFGAFIYSFNNESLEPEVEEENSKNYWWFILIPVIAGFIWWRVSDFDRKSNTSNI